MKYTLGVALGLAALLCGCSHVEKSADVDLNPPHKLMESVSMNAPMVASPPQAEGRDNEATADVLPGPRPYTETIVAPSRLLIYHADLRLKVAILDTVNTATSQRMVDAIRASSDLRIATTTPSHKELQCIPGALVPGG